MRRPSLKELTAALDAINDEMGLIRRQIPEISRRGNFPVSDGYPAGGASGGPSGPSDPTPVAALRRPQSDPVGKAIWDIERAIIDISKRVHVMRSQRIYVQQIESGERGHVNAIPDCVNSSCARSLHDQGPGGRGIAGRCAACYEYLRRTGMDAGSGVIAARVAR